jgi:hypothetical protein
MESSFSLLSSFRIFVFRCGKKLKFCVGIDLSTQDVVPAIGVLYRLLY